MYDIITEAFWRCPLFTVSLRLVFFFCVLILDSINGERDQIAQEMLTENKMEEALECHLVQYSVFI